MCSWRQLQIPTGNRLHVTSNGNMGDPTPTVTTKYNNSDLPVTFVNGNLYLKTILLFFNL